MGEALPGEGEFTVCKLRCLNLSAHQYESGELMESWLDRTNPTRTVHFNPK